LTARFIVTRAGEGRAGRAVRTARQADGDGVPGLNNREWRHLHFVFDMHRLRTPSLSGWCSAAFAVRRAQHAPTRRASGRCSTGAARQRANASRALGCSCERAPTQSRLCSEGRGSISPLSGRWYTRRRPDCGRRTPPSEMWPGRTPTPSPAPSWATWRRVGATSAMGCGLS